MVNQTRIARTAYDASATQNFRSLSEPVLPNSSVMRSRAAPRPEFCIKRNLTLQKPGAQGRIRTSVARKERQIYSLLPLTARPPVPNFSFFHSRLLWRITHCPENIRKPTACAPQWDRRGGYAGGGIGRSRWKLMPFRTPDCASFN
jgi:hypothetical protein